MNIKFYLTPNNVTKLLLSVIMVLLVANLTAIFFKFILGHPQVLGFVDAFYFDREKNIPSLYSSLAILICSMLLFYVARVKKQEQSKSEAVYWYGLSGIFLFLSIDELLSLHELLIPFVRHGLGKYAKIGYLKYAWFIPYLILFTLVALFFLKFFIKLPSNTKISFLIAGILFLIGAVGMEMIGGEQVTQQGFENLKYALIATVEELLEMGGIALFIRAILVYAVENLIIHQVSLQMNLASAYPVKENA